MLEKLIIVPELFDIKYPLKYTGLFSFCDTFFFNYLPWVIGILFYFSPIKHIHKLIVKTE